MKNTEKKTNDQNQIDFEESFELLTTRIAVLKGLFTRIKTATEIMDITYVWEWICHENFREFVNHPSKIQNYNQISIKECKKFLRENNLPLERVEFSPDELARLEAKTTYQKD